MKQKEAVLRKPNGILLSVLGLLLFTMATIPVGAQNSLYTDPRYLLGPPSVTPGLPGEQLVRAAVADLYTYNFKPAIPLLEKGVSFSPVCLFPIVSFAFTSVPRHLGCDPVFVRLGKNFDGETSRSSEIERP